jgi:hypothetical protein
MEVKEDQHENNKETPDIITHPSSNSLNDKNTISSSTFCSSIIKGIDFAPDVDISNLVNNKNQEDIEKFKSGYYVPDKQNHITGYVNTHTIQDFNFKEQYYTYNSFGYSQDPTDFSQNKIVENQDMKKIALDQTVFGNNQGSKSYRKKLKNTRQKFGNPATGEFNGPWAIYEGEEVFKNLSGGELTEEQKDLLMKMEEKRKKKIEDEKLSEKKMLNVKYIFIIFLVSAFYNFSPSR